MLFDIDGNEIKRIPHKKDYDRWFEGLLSSEYRAIITELHHLMDEKDVFTSSYIPGTDWTGTVYQPIYHACGENFEQAALFYGLLVWDAAMQHEEEWRFIRQERDDDKPIGLTYFKRKT